MDSKGVDQLLQSFQKEFEELQNNEELSRDLCLFDEVIPISAKFSNKSVQILKHSLRHWMDENDALKTESNISKLEHSLEASKVENIIQWPCILYKDKKIQSFSQIWKLYFFNLIKSLSLF